MAVRSSDSPIGRIKFAIDCARTIDSRLRQMSRARGTFSLSLSKLAQRDVNDGYGREQFLLTRRDSRRIALTREQCRREAVGGPGPWNVELSVSGRRAYANASLCENGSTYPVPRPLTEPTDFRAMTRSERAPIRFIDQPNLAEREWMISADTRDHPLCHVMRDWLSTIVDPKIVIFPTKRR